MNIYQRAECAPDRTVSPSGKSSGIGTFVIVMVVAFVVITVVISIGFLVRYVYLKKEENPEESIQDILTGMPAMQVSSIIHLSIYI